MKKILFLLLALFTLTVSATPLPNDTATEQIPDSVYVVAYFCKNDTLEYIYSNEQIKIKGTDTTTTIITEGKFRLVVLDSTATGYRIQYDQLEIGSPLTDKLKELANDKNNLIESISSLINNTSINNNPIIFTTNELGEIQHIENWQEIRNQLLHITESLITNIYNSIPQANEYINKDSFIDLFKQRYDSEELFIENFEGFPLLFTFHGSAFKAGQSTVDDQGNEQEYPSTVQLYANNLDPEEEGRDDFSPDYVVSLVTSTSMQGDEVKELLGSIMGLMLNNNSKTDELKDSLNDTKDFDNATLTITDGINAEYWINGWPSEIIHFNNTEVTAPGQHSQSRIKAKSLECVYRSCFNFMR